MQPTARRLLVGVPLLALCGLFLLVRLHEGLEPWWRHLFVDSVWALFSLGATIACVRTALRIPPGGLRRAWWLFGAGCCSWFLGILEWTRLELIVGWLNPFPSLADPLYLAMPLLFIAGMACLRLDARTRPLSLLQVSNVGLAMAAVAVVVSLALAAPAGAGGSPLGTLVLAANVVFFAADFLFGLYCLVATPAAVRLRRVLALIVLGQGVNTLVVLAYVREVNDASYAVGGWLDVAFCVLFSMMILAAHEQSLQPDAASGAPPPGRPELTRLDTLVPALTIGGAVLAGLAYRENLAVASAGLLALEGLLLASFCALHGLASRRMMSDLREELRRSQDQAREAQKLEALGRLASGLAHEFNNTLTVVRGQLTLLERTGSPDCLQAIDAAVTQGADLTRSMLSLARPSDEGRGRVDVKSLLLAVQRLVKAVVPPTIQVVVQVSGVPPVQLGSGRIQQAILNLALNARDAMRGGGQMVLGARVREEGGAPCLELFVSDEGEGMPPAVAARVFEPFFTTKASGAGTGLGLAMVAEVARSHGGEARVHTEPGRGSTFSLLLPLAEARPPNGHADPTAGPPGRPRALVVDDEERVARTVREVMEQADWEIEVASDGGAALGLLRGGGRFAAVVTDLDMPGGDGLQLAQDIRASWPDLPVILLTGDLPRSEPQAGLFSARLQKPFLPDRLREALEAIRARGPEPVQTRAHAGDRQEAR